MQAQYSPSGKFAEQAKWELQTLTMRLAWNDHHEHSKDGIYLIFWNYP